MFDFINLSLYKFCVPDEHSTEASRKMWSRLVLLIIIYYISTNLSDVTILIEWVSNQTRVNSYGFTSGPKKRNDECPSLDLTHSLFDCMWRPFLSVSF